MKKIAIIAVMLISIASFAQKDQMHEKKHRQDKPEMTAEQRATLMTKKMALKLDLNQSQQNDLKKLFTENAKEHDKMMAARKAMKEDAKAEKDHFNMMNKRLDMQLAQQEKMKKILNEEQYKKWKAMSERRANKHHYMMRESDHHKNGDHKKEDRKVNDR